MKENEQMKKSFGTYRKIMGWFEGFLLAIPIIIVVAATVLISSKIIEEDNPDEVIIQEADPDLAEEEVTCWTILSNLAEKRFDYESDNKVVLVVLSICVVVDYIFIVCLVDLIKKIFYEVETNGTPFTKHNVRYFSILSKVAIIMALLRVVSVGIGAPDVGMGLILLIVILSLSKVFEYGYELQNKVDNKE